MIFIAHHALAVAAILLAGYYVGRHSIWPWQPCPACRGRRGRGIGSTPGAYNRCGWCASSGESLHWIAHLTRRKLVAAQKARRDK